jgi:hypothetical protein
MPEGKGDMLVESDEKHKVITLDMKPGIIQLFDNGQSQTNISRVLDHSKSMVCPNLMNT